MPRPTDPADVERALNDIGAGWFLRLGDRGAILDELAREIDAFVELYRSRYGVAPSPLALVDENPEKAAAFFEVLTSPSVSIEMRIAVWRLLGGAVIQGVRFEYDREGDSELVLTLVVPGGRPERFRSEDLWDFEVLRHVAILSVDGRPFLDGFYSSYMPD